MRPILFEGPATLLTRNVRPRNARERINRQFGAVLNNNCVKRVDIKFRRQLAAQRNRRCAVNKYARVTNSRIIFLSRPLSGPRWFYRRHLPGPMKFFDSHARRWKFRAKFSENLRARLLQPDQRWIKNFGKLKAAFQTARNFRNGITLTTGLGNA